METTKYRKFIAKLNKKNRDKRRPLKAMIELTYKCNYRCIHCYNAEDNDKDELSKKEAFFIIDQLVDMGIIQVAFTGGEIFTRPDIMDTLLYARKKGLRVAIMTNGSLITDKITDRLISIGITKFEISFLGATKKTFDSITRTEGSFDRIVSALQMLRKKGIIATIKTCVINMNLQEIDKIADLAKELDVSFSYSPFIIPRLNLDKTPLDLKICPEELLDIRKKFRRFHDKSKIDGTQKKRKQVKKLGFWERENLFNCMAGRTVVFISPYAEMKACLILPKPSYDLRKGSVKEGWEMIKEFVDNIKPPKDWKCFSCEYQNRCSWCPGRAYLNTGDIFGCPEYFKELAKIKTKRYDRRTRV